MRFSRLTTELEGPQEILQIDNDIRDKLKMPRKGAAWKQPWSISREERKPKALVSPRLTFPSDTSCDFTTYLALELQAGMKVSLNETDIEPDADARNREWWVDEAITKIRLPKGIIRKGNNVLDLTFPFGLLTNIERVYVLGPFAVKADGRVAGIHASSAPRLSWGDITSQGLPFYAGNVVYEFSFELDNVLNTTLSVQKFSSPVLKIEKARGSKWESHGHIAIQPRRLNLGTLDAGRHTYRITAFGNRYNAFGHIHLPDWVGGCWPDIWRSKNS